MPTIHEVATITSKGQITLPKPIRQALGVDAGPYATLAHFPDTSAVWLERDDDTGFQQVLERADYLAKEHTKAHATGERNFGCSRS